VLIESRREFIRHTADVPIQIRTVANGRRRSRRSLNVSFGGLAFDSDEYVEPGTSVEVEIAQVKPAFEARAVVVWCLPEGDRFSVGISFLDPADAFRSRMVQQVCAIERYRQEVREREGRELSGGEAAAEWIGKYADRFPDGGAT
jgi:hypothetical protein